LQRKCREVEVEVVEESKQGRWRNEERKHTQWD